jgi:hypothetical protein
MMGDAADNIPGLPVGAVTARNFLNLGTMENLLANTDES